MTSLFRRAAGAALFSLAVGLLPGQAKPCSVCQAGDPLFGQQGVSAQASGARSVYLAFQSSHLTSGSLPHDGTADDEGDDHAEGDAHANGSETHDVQQFDLYLSWTPLDRLTLTLDVPYRFQSIDEREPGEPSSHVHNAGVGDLGLWLSGVLWRDRPVLPSTWIEGRLLLKAPTGRSHERFDGERDPHIQSGTGSWDTGFGLAAARRLTRGAFYGSVFYRLNAEGTWEYEYGDVFLANAAFESPLSHLLAIPGFDWLTPGVELNFRSSGSDHSHGERYRDSGGSIAYATPSLRIRLPFGGERGAASLRLAAQIPLGQGGLRGEQHERTTWMGGLLYAF